MAAYVSVDGGHEIMFRLLIALFFLVGCSPKAPTSDIGLVQGANSSPPVTLIPFEFTYDSQLNLRMTADGIVKMGYTESRLDSRDGEVTTTSTEKDWIRVSADGKVTALDGTYLARLTSDGRVLDHQDKGSLTNKLNVHPDLML
jgi:hypothetical protein